METADKIHQFEVNRQQLKSLVSYLLHCQRSLQLIPITIVFSVIVMVIPGMIGAPHDTDHVAVPQLANATDTEERELITQIESAQKFLQSNRATDAVITLESLLHLTDTIKNKALVAALYASLGVGYYKLGNLTHAERVLKESIGLIEFDPVSPQIIRAYQNLAMVYWAGKNYQRAQMMWESGVAMSRSLDQPLLQSVITINLARSYMEQKKFSAAYELISTLPLILPQLPKSPEGIVLLLNLGSLLQILNEHGYSWDDTAAPTVLTLYQRAYLWATDYGTDYHRSLAAGELGNHYYHDHEYDKALERLREAAFFAQLADAPRLTAQWLWLLGKIHYSGSRHSLAELSWRGAITAVQQCRSELPNRMGEDDVIMTQPSFRQQWGDLYYSLTDLLLQKAESTSDDVKCQFLFREGRQIIENLKTAELAEYVNDDCVLHTLNQQRTIDDTSATAIVLYVISLPERCDLLVSRAGQICRYSIPVGADEIQRTTLTLRQQLETRTTHRYLNSSRKLYSWLIEPWEKSLAADDINIDTLIFIPDGALAAIPLAALHNGEQFLLERYAVTLLPGLTLSVPDPRAAISENVLLCGLTTAVQGYDALTYSTRELTDLQQIFPHSLMLVDRDYSRDHLSAAFSARTFSIVHIATHGEFGGDTHPAFFLTYDDKILLNDVESMIRPLRRQGNPIQLLTLSACQTAAGDERSMLGLAGMAYKSGARSVLATLWYVNDEVSSILMPAFYRQLSARDRSVTKAEILRDCQLALLHDNRYRHPCYWAPYILIGDWL